MESPNYIVLVLGSCIIIGLFLVFIYHPKAKKGSPPQSKAEVEQKDQCSEPVITLIKLMGSNKVDVSMEHEFHYGYGKELYTLSFYDPATNYQFKLFMRYTDRVIQTIVPSIECDWMTQDEMEAIWAAWEDINKKRHLKKLAAKRQSVVDLYNDQQQKD